MICNSCGGIVGRDCFNPQECAQIGWQQEQEQQRQFSQAQEEMIALHKRVAELEERLTNHPTEGQ